MQISRFTWTLALAGLLTCTAQAQNDECSAAITIALGTTSFNTSGATTSFPWPCAAGGSDLWYSFTAPNNANYTFSTCAGTGYDSALEVFSGTCTSLVSQACNDDSCGLQSSLTLPAAIQGTNYYLRIGGFASGTGAGTLTVTEFIPPPPGAGDECSTALPLTVGQTSFDTSTMTTSRPWPCGLGGNDVWFRFTAPSSAAFRFETCFMTSFDSTLEVLSGTCAALTSVDCNDDACGFQSEVDLLNAVAGTDYFVRVGGYASQVGAGTLTVAEIVPPVTLSNQDDCSNAAIDTISAGTFNWNNSQATTGAVGQNEGICYAFGQTAIHNDVWAVYTAGTTGDVFIETCGAEGTNGDTKIAAYPLANCGQIDGTSVACNDDECGLRSQISFSVACGESYLLQLGSFSSSGGGTSQLFITETGNSCGPGGLGSPAPCQPLIPNSDGTFATISAFGESSIAARNVNLQVDNVPIAQVGMFFTSQTLGALPQPGGSMGTICVLGTQARYNNPVYLFVGLGPGVPVPPGGLPVGTLPVPMTPPLPAFSVGSPWYFQAWHRDIGGTSNFSTVIQITFTL